MTRAQAHLPRLDNNGEKKREKGRRVEGLKKEEKDEPPLHKKKKMSAPPPPPFPTIFRSTLANKAFKLEF